MVNNHCKSYHYELEPLMRGATNGTDDDSKRTVTSPPAGDEASRHQRYERTMVDVPGPPEPPSNNLRQPTEYVDPLDE